MMHIRFFLILVLACLFACFSVRAQDMAYDPDAAYVQARELAFAGRYLQARDTLTRILRDYPEYTDVENLLASTYTWEGAYDQARGHYNRITSRDRSAEEAWVGAVKNEWYAGNHSLALGLANKALKYLESSMEIQEIRQAILDANTAAAVQERPGEEPVISSNVIALQNAMEIFDQTYEPMIYGSLEYQRLGAFGKLIPRINYSYRFQTHGLQAELDYYPKLSETFRGYLNYGYSNAPTYPHHRGGAELYAFFGKGSEVSAGVRYLDFTEQQATLITGSYSLYRGNYFLNFRPFMTLFKDRAPGFSANLMVRRYLSNRFHYLGVRAQYGYTTEFQQLWAGTQLQAETLLFVESQQLQAEYQFTAGPLDRRIKAQLGVSRQEFIQEPGAYFWALRAGLRFEVGF
ncbi:YaiO family outer membrane beta-barrel protein [Robiginitalea sp. M366]|uniref:YaiO family outer membrane beta-barrel protein n=1 Tax=Robiginitalea aestuariiviva TaxID=3036903 RepID=UPI00240D9945|nr:YaiO family outer membrane beta-barrel protein [Robiginitalea aestuariiviva]MDG1572939.1 YaiO family outer membrane beta-barrel protein [Robiginitalea aestuariiviva]